LQEKQNEIMRTEKCGCCGTETETFYVMSQRDDGSWFEKNGWKPYGAQ